ncbi:AlpA family phage regulatory protein [Seohaeicola sp. SP36]|nr:MULTISPECIES: AlpA family phage regulatory protein [unclassified Seohaeicola]MDD9708311.1 AlpA family phage regulatory protein [Seohaeicola sp. 4SK31]MDD9736534.1 AlpA family phage regulatory protein [Seohaeicola sp. SP36]
MAERILRRPEVEARTGLSRSTIYLWIQQGEFPKPVALGARLVG